MQGDDDATVPFRSSVTFVDLIKETTPNTSVRFDQAPGMDHAFDIIPENWASFKQPALDFVVKNWLGKA